MGLGSGGPESRRAQAQVGTLIAGAFVVLAVGLARMSADGGTTGDELAAARTQRMAIGEDSAATTIPPSQPAVAVSFTGTGQIIRPAPVTARIIDPETGEEVVVPLPPGSTVVDGEVVPIGSAGTSGPGSSGTTRPGTGTTSTTAGGSSTTKPPTTTTTTEPTTTTTTTEPTTTTTTTEPTTTTTTTEPTTTTTTETPTTPPQALGGLLGDLLD